MLVRRFAPWPALSVLAPSDDEGGGGEPKGDENGFPAQTAVQEMTAEQQVAYWKHQARKHEDRSKARGDYDQLKADSDELKRLRTESQTEQEKAVEAAREEGRRHGENLGAARYLTDAIRADLRASTGKTNEELASVMDVIDTSKFVTTNGDIDSAKLADFAQSFGVTSTGPSSDPVREALERGQTPRANTSGSVNARRRERREELTKHR